MPIIERISDDFKDALKRGDKIKVSILRMIKAAIKNSEIEKKASLNDDEINGILRSFVKRAKDSIEQFKKADRTELVEKEKEELAIIQSYLPKQLKEDEINNIIAEEISELGAAGPENIGKVMKVVMAKLKGQADGKLVNNIVRKMLEV
jgi:uncharacterized protein YqeY